MKQLDSYLQGPQPGYAMLIGGSWGVGKSFVWQRYSEKLQEITPITISAAGLQTAEDLERALFQASISDLGPKPMIELGSVVGRALQRVVKVDPDDIKLKADVTGGRSVVCIDDIERFAGDFNVIFGFVVNLIDVNGVHCVLIADEERADGRFKNEYGRYKERIVGKTIVLQSNIHDFCDQVIRGFANQQVREAMLGGAERIVALIEGAKLKNLRAVRFLLTEMEIVLRSLSPDLINRAIASSLPSALLFWIGATSKDAGNLRVVKRVFLNQAIDFELATRIYEKRKNGQENDKAVPDDIDKFSDLLNELGLSQEHGNWPTSSAFVDHVLGLERADYRQLSIDFGLVEAVAQHYDPISVINHYATHSDQDVQAAIKIAHDEFHGDPAEVTRLFRIYRTLDYMASRGIFSMPQYAWRREVVDRLTGLIAEPHCVIPGVFEIFPGSYDPEEQPVFEKFEQVHNAVLDLRKANDRNDALAALLDGRAIGIDATISPLLVAVEGSESELLAKLRMAGVHAVLRLKEILSKRLAITNVATCVKADRISAIVLADHIEDSLNVARPMLILESELKELAWTLRRFVIHVDGNGA
ncbi:P-loop NTPase fold protein [Xanthomonas hortorum]|uniref:KAP NTPase domain-containing protein n=1 Tax=Xanthomonas hortorum pv. carotae TaxID=487904 RepID=A0A6V7EZ26_9XANT|nr:P-loop NTPase fold protein [Xanthomonas hortorum]ETC88561.1 hypothetical protein XHC_1919 [Xanthomonas hortorum pv. carotae str. M081]CAD0356304.1 hypothetical protein CFBP7900_28400 [Xanthomonas hortorum pv. carotae]CAD0356311.1 hypothetical protein CFBP7900_28400 [Xanthomonas hortorum pv. carotae]